MVTPSKFVIGVNGKTVWHVNFEPSTSSLESMFSSIRLKTKKLLYFYLRYFWTKVVQSHRLKPIFRSENSIRGNSELWKPCCEQSYYIYIVSHAVSYLYIVQHTIFTFGPVKSCNFKKKIESSWSKTVHLTHYFSVIKFSQNSLSPNHFTEYFHINMAYGFT